MTKNKHEIQQLASDHVEWFLKAIKPLLIDHMVHGYKHGFDDANQEQPEFKHKRFTGDIKVIYQLVRDEIITLSRGAEITGLPFAIFRNRYFTWENEREAQF